MKHFRKYATERRENLTQSSEHSNAVFCWNMVTS